MFPNEPMRSTVLFHAEHIEFALENEARISEWLTGVIDREGYKLDLINVIFTSDEHLLSINKEYLDHDYYTDIITFPFASNPIEGDLFISIDRIRDNAIIQEVAFERELYRVIVHGVLHLCGYGDKSAEEELVMRSKEDEHLLKLP